MPSMPAPGAQESADWPGEILEAAREFMTGRVCFYRVSDEGDYDPVTGEGGEGQIEILHHGPARVQHLRTPREFTTQYDVDTTRYIRMQMDPEGFPEIYEGTYCRVLDGGRDKSLESYLLTVNAAINSTQMAVRTIEAAANMKRNSWTWTVDEDGKVVNL